MATWDQHYRYDKYLFCHAAETVFAARVNQSTFSYPIYSVEYDGVTTGAYGDIQIGQTVLFGSTAGGDDLGRQRIRSAADADTLFFGWSSNGTRDGEVDLTNNAYITVLDDFRVLAKVPRGTKTGLLYKDYDIGYATGTPAPPVANGGTAVAILVDSSDEITVDFDAGDSFAVASGATIASYAWDFGDGTPASAATETVSGVVFPVGFRWVHLTVTDSNGKTHTHHIPVLAAKASGAGQNVFTKFEVTNQILRRGGQDISFAIFDDLADTTYYDGFLTIYFETEYYNDVEACLAGDIDRYNIKFVGWHDTDTTSLNTSEATYATGLELACVDVGGRMRQLPSFPQAVLRDAAPGSWMELIAANTDRYMHYLLHWHSTVLNLAPFTWSGTGDTYALPRFQSAGDNFWEEIYFRAASIGHDLTVSPQGALGVIPDPQLQDSGDRTATVIVDITESEWTNISYTRQRPPRVYWLWGNAIIASTSEADTPGLKIRGVYCVAPGRAPGQGGNEQAQGQQLVTGQTELNAREGHRYAARLNPTETYFEIELVHPGDVGLYPSLLEWARLTIPADLAGKRADTYTLARFLPFELEIQHNNTTQTKTLFLRAEREVVGLPAATDKQPVAATSDGTGGGVWPGTADVILPGYQDPDGWPEVFEGSATADSPTTVYAADERYVKRTTNFLDTTPTWTTVYDVVSAIGAGWYILDYQPDNLAPKTKSSVVVSDKATTVRVYSTTNLSTNPPTWTLKYSIAIASQRAMLQNSIYNGVWFLLVQSGNNANLYRTINDWSSVNNITAVTGAAPAGGWHSFFISNHAKSTSNGLVICSHSEGASLPHVTISRNYGTSFTPDLTYTFSDYHAPSYVHVPYHGNQAENTWFVFGGEDLSQDAWIKRTTDGGDTYDDITPIYDDGGGPLPYGGGERNVDFRRLMYDHTQDGQKLAIVAAVSSEKHGGHDQQLFVSDDNGDNWTRVRAFAPDINGIGGWPYDPDILFFTGQAKLYYSSDGGVTIAEKQWAGYTEGIWTVPIWVA